jgi:nicotinamide-nucleotide amidase
MQAAIITIGDELLIGQTLNSNAAWIGQELSNQGIRIYRSITIRDERQDILDVVDDFMNSADLVIVTGGLGPTKDDITKETLCEYFDTSLELNDRVLSRIKKYFEDRGKEMLPSNIQQAELPKGAIILDNDQGTASGMWFEKGGKVLVSIPGVPYEMKAIMTEEVLPRSKAKFGVTGNYHQTLMTQGVGESFLAEQIEDWENRIYKDDLFLAYLPSPGIVKLRLTSKKGATDAEKVENYFRELREKLPKYVYGMNGETIFEVVGDMLRKEQSTLGTVESCTGGGIANAFIQKSGSSDFFLGGLVTYSNDLKVKLAYVEQETLDSQGAVSEETVKEMALGGRKNLNVDYTIAVSGIAGPDGGTEEKPVGTVWIAVAHPKGVVAKKFLFGEHRGRNLEKTQLYAANMLRRVLLGLG